MRITATNPKNPDFNQYLFPCDCNDRHYLHFEWWSDEEDWPGYLEITGTVWAKSLWSRVRAATLILRGRHQYNDGIVVDEETTVELIDTLNEYLEIERERKGKKGKDNGTIQPAS